MGICPTVSGRLCFLEVIVTFGSYNPSALFWEVPKALLGKGLIYTPFFSDEHATVSYPLQAEKEVGRLNA